MKGVDQDSLKKEVEEEMSTPPVSEEISDVPSYDDIPDWLKNSPIDSGEMTEESSPDSLESPKIEENQAIIVEPKQKQPIPIKKQPKAPILSKVQESDTTPVVDTISKEGKDKNIIDTAPPRPKKKKPTPIISE